MKMETNNIKNYKKETKSFMDLLERIEKRVAEVIAERNKLREENERLKRIV